MDRASVFGTEGWGFESLRVQFLTGQLNRPPGAPEHRHIAINAGQKQFGTSLPAVTWLSGPPKTC
jgi:hypothetical protein